METGSRRSFWSLRSHLQDLSYLQTKFTFWPERRIRLRPGGDVTGAATGHEVTEWTMTGADPQFELVWRGAMPLAPGRYQLSIDVPSGIEHLGPSRIYIDSGKGYSEAEVIELSFWPQKDGRLSAIFSLDSRANKLRFDPTDRPGTIFMGNVRLKRLVGRAALQYDKDKSSLDYHDWIECYDTLTDDKLNSVQQRLREMRRGPLFSIIMPVFNTPEMLLRDALESVLAQVYDNWELCIADDCSTQACVKSILNEYAARDPRIKVTFRDANGHISNASNTALESARGEWVAMLDHDDLLRPHTLAEVALEIDRHPDTEVIYTDEDKVDEGGRRFDPHFKPGFSRELFRSMNYLNHLTVHRADNIRAVGGWRPGFEGSQDYDLNLRILERIDPKRIRHIPKVLYHWRALQGSTAFLGTEKSYAYDAGMRALQEHVTRTGLAARVERAPDVPYYRIRFFVPQPEPLVTLIIPTRDRADLLRNCVASIRDKTTYSNYEIIIVDNGSTESETLNYFDGLKDVKGVKVLKYDRPFNFSAINNFAVDSAEGSIIGLINNDIEVISPGWLTEMVSWAAQEDVGCVGAKLLYGNEKIQHAGVILGVGGVAGHSHKFFRRDAVGYFSRLKLVQNVSAVTGACLVVRKRVYDEVGGLNERELSVAFNDVDFCLRVQQAGYSNVWTPHAELYHLESVSRGYETSSEKVARFKQEIDFMEASWGPALRSDSFYSPNLTLEREDFAIASRREWTRVSETVG